MTRSIFAAQSAFMATVSATAVAGKAAIRAADTVEAKQAAFGAIEWPAKEGEVA